MQRKDSQKRQSTWRLPIAFFLLGSALIGGVLLWTFELDEEHLDSEVELTAAQLRLRLDAWIGARLAIVKHLALSPEARQRDHVGFTGESTLITHLYEGFQALNWVDAEGFIRVIVPVKGNEPALNRNLHDHPSKDIQETLDRALETGEMSASGVIPLLQGGQGFVTYQSIGDPSAPSGLVNGVFRIETLIDTCFAEGVLREGYRFRLVDPSGQVAYSYNPDSEDEGSWSSAAREPIQIVDRTWTLELAAANRQLGRAHTLGPWAFAAIGVVLFGLLALLLRANLSRLGELHESRARYRLLVENVADLIIKVDRQGRFLYASPSYCNTFGKTEEELLGREFLPLVHDEDQRATIDAMKTLHTPPHACSLEQRSMTRDGWRWLAWSNTAVLNPAGEVEEIIGVGRDVTVQKELEAKLIQSQKLQAIGQLAGGIAHDFNNILQSMIGYLDLVINELGEDHEVLDDLRQVEEGAERATALTRQLLAFSRKQVLHLEAVDLNGLVDGVLRMLDPIIGANIQIDFVPDPKLGLVHGDLHQLEQVLVNLCVNARDAMPNGGRLTIRTETRTSNDLGHQGIFVSMSVEDEGVGMEPETLAQIFYPFFTTKETGKGTGLGLATTHGIVDQHGGFIEVSSEPGAGSTFTVFLPQLSEEPDSAPPEVSEGQWRGTGTLVVGEDDVSVRQFISRVLEKAGYTVHPVPNGREAVEVVDALGGNVDAVLLDVIMPVLGGRGAAAELHERYPSLPILFVTGYDPNDNSPPPAGNRILSKPVSPVTLRKTVYELLEESKP